jgi:hypothetical protein
MESERVRLQGLADQNLAAKREMAQVERITGVAMRTNSYPMNDGSTPLLASLAAAAGEDESWPTAAEIIDAVIEATGLDHKQAITAIMRCDFSVALERAA